MHWVFFPSGAAHLLDVYYIYKIELLIELL